MSTQIIIKVGQLYGSIVYAVFQFRDKIVKPRAHSMNCSVRKPISSSFELGLKHSNPLLRLYGHPCNKQSNGLTIEILKNSGRSISMDKLPTMTTPINGNMKSLKYVEIPFGNFQ
jgi:hypothetical protein